MKVAIVGSRDFPHEDRVREFVRTLRPDDEVVSGGARGPDRWGVDEALQLGLRVKVVPAKWDTDGKAAGFNRNHLIVAYADRVVAFWDGKSRGTAQTMSLAKVANKRLDVVRANEGKAND